MIGDCNIRDYHWKDDNCFSYAVGYHLNIDIRHAAWQMSSFVKTKIYFKHITANSKAVYLDIIIFKVIVTLIDIAVDTVSECDQCHSSLEISFLTLLNSNLRSDNFIFDKNKIKL